MNLEYIWTEDGLRLVGPHYSGEEVCVLMVHGMAGSFVDSYFAQVLGRGLAEQNVGFLYGHNRGYTHINELIVKSDRESGDTELVKMGTTYELFKDSPKDIAAWIKKVKELGYKKIILLGHSLGCNKIIYYLYRNPGVDLDGVIFASPPDLSGLAVKFQPNHHELAQVAKQLIDEGKPREILPGEVWDWFKLSAQTYLSLFEEAGPADNLPVQRNPEKWEQLSAVKQPVLAIMGENDDIPIRSLQEDIELIRSKAVNCPEFEYRIIEGANHYYKDKEEDFSDAVLDWVKSYESV